MQLSDVTSGSGPKKSEAGNRNIGKHNSRTLTKSRRKKLRHQPGHGDYNGDGGDGDGGTPAKSVFDGALNDSRQSKSETAATQSSPTLSLTPKRRKRRLENLHSSLSPKYIGFNTPLSAAMDAGTRSLRRRPYPNSAETSNLCEFVSEIHTPPMCKTLSVSLSPLRKPYVSPIDKLLLKNGSTIVKTNLTEVNHQKNSEETNLSQTIANEKHTKDANEAPGLENVDFEGLIPCNLVQESRCNSMEDGLDEWTLSEGHTSPEKIIVKMGDENTINRDGAVDKTDQSAGRAIQSQAVVELNISETTSVEAIDNIDNDTAVKLNTVHTPVQVIDLDASELPENAIIDTTNAVTAKSPSTVSVDSAKGSSIANDTVWMSFSTGDLFWGQIYTYSYWPCMVCPDPEGKTITTEGSIRSGEQHVLVHVRFFADNGRRNWVKRENLIPYNGLESYNDRVQEVKQKYGKKNLKYKVLVPKKAKLPVWHEAINEANFVADTVHSERLEKFYKIYEQAMALQKLARKRRKSMLYPQESTSDIGSLCDSTDNLVSKQFLAAAKRERSISPFSPVFSPVKSVTTKKRKLSANGSELFADAAKGDTSDNQLMAVSSSPVKEISSLPFSAQSAEQSVNRGSSEFRKFFLTIKDFLMDQNNDEKLEQSLLAGVRNIWALGEISKAQRQQRLLDAYNDQSLGSSVVESGRSEHSLKRLSNRLKKLNVQRSLFFQSVQIEEAKQVAAQPQKQKEVHTDEKPKKSLNRPIEEVIDDIFELDRKYLFKDMGRGPICKYCLQPGGKLERCGKSCHAWLHAECLTAPKNGAQRRSFRRLSTSSMQTAPMLCAATQAFTQESEEAIGHITAESETASTTVVCRECALGQHQEVCSVCGRTDATPEQLVSCNMPQCFKTFHPECCKYWPQAKITKSKNNIESFRCPSHVCHTCVSDDPKGKFQHLSNAKLTKCVKCPASYHTDSTCIPAGSQILTAAHIICPRHSSTKSDASVNVSWCFICVGGGQVVCCETCPTAVHAACLNIPLDSNEAYICEECESGRMPLYGEMVWAKFNTFRWWPAIILPPSEVPQNIMRKAHNAADFVVRFFGTHDHGWISRRRVYLYMEGDSSEPPRSKSHLDQSYNRGVEEAKKVYEILKSKRQVQRLSNESKEKLHPQPYVRIKTNRPVPPVKLHIDMEKVNKCECDAQLENPCGPDSNCLNRVLYHECNPKLCPAGERCQNQMFELRVSPRLEVIYMRERGFGLMCREPLPEGSFVIEYVGEIINDLEFKQRLAQKSVDRDENFYFLSVEKDYIIDAGPKGNLARFMNHSCDPNCETQKWSVNGLNRIGLFTIRDIPADTELTFNYHWDELLGSEKKACLCGAGKCAGQIGSKYREEKVKDHLESQIIVKVKTSNAKKRKPVKRLRKQKEKEAPKGKKATKMNGSGPVGSSKLIVTEGQKRSEPDCTEEATESDATRNIF